MLILGGDFETTGLEPDRHGVTEVGMVLWESDLKIPLKVMGYFVNPGPVEWDPETIAITGITKELVEKYGYPSERGLRQFLSWYEQADVICAHNGARFDKKFLKSWVARHFQYELKKHWIDTNHDLDLPPKFSRKLTYMAADHQFLNPFPHRAVFDVMTMFKVLGEYDINRVLEISKSPTLVVQAIVSFEDRNLAKDRGFRAKYENGRFIRWEMNVKECFFEREFKDCEFKVEIIGPMVED